MILGYPAMHSEKLQLWKGGSFTLHPQFGYGDKSLNPGGVLFVTNTAMMMPVKSGRTAVLTSLFLKQKFGDRYTLTIGKITGKVLSLSKLRGRVHRSEKNDVPLQRDAWPVIIAS